MWRKPSAHGDVEPTRHGRADFEQAGRRYVGSAVTTVEGRGGLVRRQRRDAGVVAGSVVAAGAKMCLLMAQQVIQTTSVRTTAYESVHSRRPDVAVRPLAHRRRLLGAERTRNLVTPSFESDSVSLCPSDD